MLYTQLCQILADFKNSFTVIISRKFAMQHLLNIPPHLKRVATLPCEMFMSVNSLLISEIHLIISLHFSVVKTMHRDLKMIVRHVKVIFFCFNIKYSMVFIEYMLRWISHSPCITAHRTRSFSDINISQGSVATRLRCGGIVSDHCITNFPEIVTVKEFLKSANIWQSYV